MKPASDRRKLQQALSWKLRVVMGARSNLYPREAVLSREIQDSLRHVWYELEVAERKLRAALYDMKNAPKT